MTPPVPCPNPPDPLAAGLRADAALAAAAREDPRAFGPLYERYVDQVYRYCYVRLRSREAAEDATGEVFLRALAGLGSYRGGLFTAWLFRIARSVVVDSQRRRRPHEPVDSAGDRPDPALTPEEWAVAGAERAALWRALAELPEDQRAAVELRLAGWSVDEAAAALGRSAAAVRKLQFRAVRRLRRALAEEGRA